MLYRIPLVVFTHQNFQSVEARLEVVKVTSAVDNAMDTDDARYRELEEQYLTLLGCKLKRCVEEILVTSVMYLREMKRAKINTISQSSVAEFCTMLRSALDESKLHTAFAKHILKELLLETDGIQLASY